jgi:Peptidase M15
MKDKNSIDWANPKSQISDHFTVHEATWLPTWGIYHIPSDSEKDNVLQTADKMESIRTFLGDNPVNVTCWMRPTSVNCPGNKMDGRNYNQLVGGALNSAHIVGLAVDFTVSTITCDDVKFHLVSELENFQIRMEKRPGSNWTHIDLRQPLPGHSRYFIP